MPSFSTETDIELHYRLEGAGPRLVNISGSAGDLRGPSILRDELERHFTVLSWDQRGLGRSSKPDRRFSMADYADDAAALMTHVGWDTAKVVGASFGGMVAQELAVTDSARVERLALMCTSSGGMGGSSYPLHELPDLPPDELMMFRMEIMDSRRDAAWRETNPDHLAKLIAATKAAGIGKEEPGRQAGITRQYAARAEHDVWDRLPSLGVPTFILAGKYDNQAPPPNQLALVSQIRGSKLQMYEGGHLFSVQDKHAIPDLVEFLQSH